jgi:hypothetical protein
MKYLKFLDHRVGYFLLGALLGILLSLRFELGSRTRLVSLSPDNLKTVIVKTVRHLDSEVEAEILLENPQQGLTLIATVKNVIPHRSGTEQVMWDSTASSFFITARRTSIDSSGSDFDGFFDKQKLIMYYNILDQKAYCSDEKRCLPIDASVEERFINLKRQQAKSLAR